jgi:hypothetical protein
MYRAVGHAGWSVWLCAPRTLACLQSRGSYQAAATPSAASNGLGIKRWCPPCTASACGAGLVWLCILGRSSPPHLCHRALSRGAACHGVTTGLAAQHSRSSSCSGVMHLPTRRPARAGSCLHRARRACRFPFALPRSIRPAASPHKARCWLSKQGLGNPTHTAATTLQLLSHGLCRCMAAGIQRGVAQPCCTPPAWFSARAAANDMPGPCWLAARG